MNLFLNVFVFFTFIFIFPSYAFCQITFNSDGKWETTFDYPKFCTQRGAPDGSNTSCDAIGDDGIQWTWGASAVSGNYTQSTTEAKNPLSSGRQGARFWVGDGTNSNSGSVRVNFPKAQPELWIRWYFRYQRGFNWESQDYDKLLYLRTATGSYVIPGMAWGTFYIHSSSNPSSNIYSSLKWNDYMNTPDNTANGEWMCWEMHIKMDTDATDGIARLWIDGTLVLERNDINHSGGNTTAREGWTWFEFNNNQKVVNNAGGAIRLSYAYADYDDMVIYNQTPPNKDDRGNPFIGPLPPAPPWGLNIDVQ